jgi:hypothetical protein
VLIVLRTLLYIVTLAWWISDAVLYFNRGRARPPAARVIHRILGPAFLPCAAGVVVLDVLSGPSGTWGYVSDGLYLGGSIFGWVMREKDDDDDDWKRLLHRIAGRVKSLGHRLTVEPEGASA